MLSKFNPPSASRQLLSQRIVASISLHDFWNLRSRGKRLLDFRRSFKSHFSFRQKVTAMHHSVSRDIFSPLTSLFPFRPRGLSLFFTRAFRERDGRKVDEESGEERGGRKLGGRGKERRKKDLHIPLAWLVSLYLSHSAYVLLRNHSWLRCNILATGALQFTIRGTARKTLAERGEGVTPCRIVVTNLTLFCQR